MPYQGQNHNLNTLLGDRPAFHNYRHGEGPNMHQNLPQANINPSGNMNQMGTAQTLNPPLNSQVADLGPSQLHPGTLPHSHLLPNHSSNANASVEPLLALSLASNVTNSMGQVLETTQAPSGLNNVHTVNNTSSNAPVPSSSSLGLNSTSSMPLPGSSALSNPPNPLHQPNQLQGLPGPVPGNLPNPNVPQMGYYEEGTFPPVYEPQPLYRPYEYYHNGPQAAGSSSVSGPLLFLNLVLVLLAPGQLPVLLSSLQPSFIKNDMNMPPSYHGQQLPSYNNFQHYPYRQSASFGGHPSTGPPETGRNRCPVCHKVFKRPSSLQIHFYIHTGVKMFKCEWEGCGRMFNVKSNMKRHYRLHLKREEEKRQGNQ